MKKDSTIYKLTVSAILIALGFVLSTLVVFPNMAPFQHMINVLAAVLVGPFYGTAISLIIGLMRMGMGRTINAVIGGVFGAFLSGFLYRKTNNIFGALIGEIMGTGIISAIVAYYVSKWVLGVDLGHFYYFIPFFLPSCAVGAVLGTIIAPQIEKFSRLHKN